MVASLNAMRDPGRSLFWTRPPPASSELATEDPLAFDYISQQIGLWLLPALTTRSSRAQAFALVLYGLHLAEIAAQRYGQPATDAACRELFERWERFWALATVESRDGDIPRGDPDAMRGCARRAPGLATGRRRPRARLPAHLPSAGAGESRCVPVAPATRGLGHRGHASAERRRPGYRRRVLG
jgi:hypothetical protein